FEVVDRQRFVARRGVEHHEGAVPLENFDLQLVPVERRLRRRSLRAHRAEGRHGKPENQETLHAKLLSDRKAISIHSQNFLFGRALRSRRIDDARRRPGGAMQSATRNISSSAPTTRSISPEVDAGAPPARGSTPPV